MRVSCGDIHVMSYILKANTVGEIDLELVTIAGTLKKPCNYSARGILEEFGWFEGILEEFVREKLCSG